MPPGQNPPPRPRATAGVAPTFAGFVVRLLLYLFLVSLFFSLGGMHKRMGPIQRLIVSVVTSGANALGADATADKTIVRTLGAALEINHECTGVFVLLVYGTFVLAYPAPWKQRLQGIGLGAVVLTAINVARLILLTLIASRRPAWFAYFHEYFFQGLFIALLALLASAWTEQVRRATLGRVSA
jgi:archaeosortase B (VPXXXP-CTERM-specific)